MVNCPYAAQCRDADTSACPHCENLVEKPSYYRPRRARYWWPWYPNTDGWVTITSGTGITYTSPSVYTQTFYTSKCDCTTTSDSCSCSESPDKPDASSY